MLGVYLCWLCGCVFCWPLAGDFFISTYISRLSAERMNAAGGCCTPLWTCFARCFMVCSARLLRHLKRRGNETVLFTLNEPEEFDDVANTFGDGLSGLMTDNPTRLMAWAREKGGA